MDFNYYLSHSCVLVRVDLLEDDLKEMFAAKSGSNQAKVQVVYLNQNKKWNLSRRIRE